MRIVESGFEEIISSSLYKKIESAGRTCYKSENLITETSALEFAKRIISYNHGSVLEHAYLVFEVDNKDLFEKIKNEHISFVKTSSFDKYLISSNFRALYNLYLNKDKYDCLNGIFSLMASLYNEVINFETNEDEKHFKLLSREEVMNLLPIEKDLHLSITIRFVCDRGVSHELVRHRLASFAQESTRYCNYSKDKFSHELTFVETYGLNEEQKAIWKDAMINAEKAYFALIDNGAKPEQARSVLPNSLKTEIVTTATIDEWKVIFNLRCAPQAHPDIRFLMQKVEKYFKEKGYLC